MLSWGICKRSGREACSEYVIWAVSVQTQILKFQFWFYVFTENEEYGQICTNIDNTFPKAKNHFSIQKSSLDRKTHYPHPCVFFLHLCTTMLLPVSKLRVSYGELAAGKWLRVKHTFTHRKRWRKAQGVLTFSKNRVILSAVFSAIIFILKVNSISRATKTRILQDPLITLSQTLGKKPWKGITQQCLFTCYNSLCTLPY